MSCICRNEQIIINEMGACLTENCTANQELSELKEKKKKRATSRETEQNKADKPP